MGRSVHNRRPPTRAQLAKAQANHTLCANCGLYVSLGIAVKRRGTLFCSTMCADEFFLTSD